MRRQLLFWIGVPVGVCSLPWVVLIAIISRCRKKSVNVGLGPQPLINNIYHKRALQLRGFSAETFCVSPYFITDNFDKIFADGKGSKFFLLLKFVALIRAYTWSILRHECHYLYFNGGALGSIPILNLVEPYLYKIANVRTVLMPYGGDVQTMSRTNNLMYKRALGTDYPEFYKSDRETTRRVKMWEIHADHIICGADWVDYVDHWHSLMLGHFSIDTDLWNCQSPKIPEEGFSAKRPLKILHAPNHRTIKGTQHFKRAVEQLRKEGCPVELVTIENQPNEIVKKSIRQADVIADQLIIGWYAMFAIEGMAMRRPVLCYLRSDLVEFYVESGLWVKDEIPLVNTTHDSIIEQIRMFLKKPNEIAEIGNVSRQFVKKHHSIEVIGNVFRAINKSLGVYPTCTPCQKKK